MPQLISTFSETLASQSSPSGVARALLDSLSDMGLRHVIVARLGSAMKNREATIIASEGVANWPEPEPETGACSLFPATETIIDPKITSAVAWHLDAFDTVPPTIQTFLRREGLFFGVAIPVTAFDLTRGAVMMYSVSTGLEDKLPALEVMAQAAYLRVSRLDPIEWVDAVRNDSRNLTSRERECLRWAANGKTDAEIGRILGISPHTAFAHIKSAGDKLRANSRAQAVFNALITFQIPFIAQ